MRIKVGVMLASLSLVACSASVYGADIWGLKEGSPDLKSAGHLTFGPDGILIVGDAKGASLFAIGTGETSGSVENAKLNVDELNFKAAELLGANRDEVLINDLAVNPLSGSVFLSASVGPEGVPAILRVDPSGKLTQVSLKNVAFSKIELPDAPADRIQGEGRRRSNPREESITDLAFSDGQVLVSGLSNQDAPSSVRMIPFPFLTAEVGTSIEIYHGAHGRVENSSAPRVFVPFNIDGEANLLAGFTCTPLVKFPIDSLKEGKKVRGTTMAELGNRNRPLDMIVYKKDGQDFLLMANSSRGVMKISTDGIERQEGISERIGDGGVAGQKYETIEDLKGVIQLDRLNDSSAIILVQTDSGAQNLQTIDLP